MGLRSALKGFVKGWSASEIGGGGYMAAVGSAQYGYDGAYGHFYQIQQDYFERLLDTGSDVAGKGYLALSKSALSNPFGMACMRRIVESLSEIELQAVKELPNGNREVSEYHPMLELMYANGRTPMEFISPMLHHLHFAGEVFMYRPMSFTSSTYRPFELGYICPSTFKDFIYKGIDEPQGFQNVISSETYDKVPPGGVVGYKFSAGKNAGGLFNEHFSDWDGHFKSIDNCIHFHRFNPWSIMRGLAMVEAAHMTLTQAHMAARWNRNLAKTGGRMPYYVVPEGLRPGDAITPEQREQIEEDMDHKFRERQEKNLPIVLTGNMKVVEGNVSPREADFLEGDKYNGRKICAVFRVPPILAGDVDSVGLGGGSGTKSALKDLYQDTMLPLLNAILDGLNYKIMRYWNDGYKLSYNRNAIDALQEDLEKRDKRLVLACGGPFRTINETRVLAGLEPLGPEYDIIKEPKAPAGGKQDEDKDEDRDQSGRESNNQNER